MFFDQQKFLFARSVLILALLVGMFGMTPVRPAYADSIVVTNTNDSGPGSLRQAISDATFGPGPAFGDPITFDPSLAGEIITLNSQIDIFLTTNLTIDASGLNPPVIVSGGNTSGILKINGIAIVNISNIVFTQAGAVAGTAIQMGGTAQLNVENCTFYQNQGGAIETGGSVNVTILNSTFDQNQGRALSLSGSGAKTIVSSVFTKNSSAGDGGAIYVSGASLTLIDSTFSGNVAASEGGAIASTAFENKIVNTTIDHNQAGSEGGAILFAGGNTGKIINSTFFQNQAGVKGGALVAPGGSDIEMLNSTFAGNTAAQGEEFMLIGTSTFNIHNSIFVCTTNTDFDDCYTVFAFGSPVVTDHSILGVGTLNDYGLAELADNGGPTQTMALLPDSPLLDAGDDAVCANPDVNNLDQRGVTRPQGSHCDIGAYEDQSLVRYVDHDATGNNNGSSWANAHTDLQAALAAAAPDEEIWVTAGTYKPTSTTDRTISFVLKNGVAVYGGFAGTETARTQRSYQTNVTVLSGDIGVQGDKSDNSYHVVVGSNTNNSAILDGFTITAGNADGEVLADEAQGGGMYTATGSPSLTNVIFSKNTALFAGGGMFNQGTSFPEVGSNPVLTNVTFRENSAVEGGGMRNTDYSSPILTNVTFDRNVATRSGGGMENFNYCDPVLTNVTFIDNTAGELGTGGGMMNWVGNNPTLTDVTFSGNTAQWGGGMSNYQSSPVLTNIRFTSNSASWYGGGMSNEDNSNPALTNVTFHGNTAASDMLETAAGGMHNRSSSPGLTNVTFNDNSANYIGGGMVNELGSSPELMNVTFTNNSADYGGAMLNRDANSNPTLTHVTMSNNTATINGGALGNSGSPIIINSILWGNSGGEIFNIMGTPVVTYSIVQGGHTGTGNIDQDPLLGPLQNNGGFTQTMALGAGSAAINAADDTNCAETDQRGVTRPQGSGCDMGAYETDRSPVDVIIGNSEVGSYLIAPHTAIRKGYPNVNTGPVKIVNLDDFSIIAAERAIYRVGNIATSYSEMMGLPSNQVDITYWLPWYNSKDLDTQLRIANVSMGTATVHMSIGGTPVTGSPFTIPAGVSIRKSFAGIDKGPVKIESNVEIVASERVIYKVNGLETSYSEMMALPASQVDMIYWLPWYNSKDLDTQLRIANVSGSTATVQVSIGGTPVTGSPFTIPAGKSIRRSFPNLDKGPVKIESNVDIVASERVIHKVTNVPTSFSEMMALPDSQKDMVFWLPWYNSKDLNTQLRIANVSPTDATVQVTIGGSPVAGSPFTIPAGVSRRLSFPGIDKGPVKIESNVEIVASERVIYTVNGTPTSFSEMMGLPNALLDAAYWFPWYNNVELDSQLRFGVP